MALSRFLHLHNYNYHGSAGAALPRRAASIALSSLILQFLPSLPRSSSPRYRSHCSSRSVAATEVAAEEQHQQHLSSPELVALEYADLNLSYKLVILFLS